MPEYIVPKAPFRTYLYGTLLEGYLPRTRSAIQNLVPPSILSAFLRKMFRSKQDTDLFISLQLILVSLEMYIYKSMGQKSCIEGDRFRHIARNK